MKKPNNTRKKVPLEKYALKDRIIISLLSSISIVFVVVFFGTIDIYANNQTEMPFTFLSIFGWISLVSVALVLVLFLIFMIYKSKLLVNTLSYVLIGLTFASSFYTLVMKLPFFNDFNDAQLTSSEFIIWTIFFIFVLLFGLFSKDKWKNYVIFLTILFIGMNGATLVSDFISKDLFHDNSTYNEVLSEKNLLNLSEKENVVYILVDRFDESYVDYLLDEYSNSFEYFEGFTYFNNNISCYGRTFPSVSYMISGNTYPINGSAFDFFESVYKESDFLKDLKSNGYTTNIYTKSYYTYSDGDVFDGVADNVEKVDSFTIDKKQSLSYLIQLSLGRYFPNVDDFVLTILSNEGTLNKTATFECEDEMYVADDAEFYNKLVNTGLSCYDCDKNYTFIHLEGTHPPYTLDENCQRTDVTNEGATAKGVLKILNEYINQMKELGIYDNSTIIITGDHGLPDSDLDELSQCMETALFVKPRNASNEDMVVSSAPVSHANLFQTIIDDANIKTENDYGTSVFDVDVDSTTPRYFYKLNNLKPITISTYEVTGDSSVFDNWKIIRTEVTKNKSWY